MKEDSISSVRTISVGPNGELVAYTMDSSIFIWDIQRRQTHCLFNEHTSGIDGLVWRSSKYLASASDDKTVRFWAVSNEENEADDLKSLCILAEHSDEVKSVSFSSDGSRLASGSSDRTIRIWTWKESDKA
jgi:WD40 repeat protein